MKFLLLINVSIGSMWADTGALLRPENTTECVRPENLVAKTASGIPRTEFYSCTGPTIRPELRQLDAIVEYGHKTDGRAIIFCVAETFGDAVQLKKKYPGTKFLSREDALYSVYEKELKRLLKKKR